MTHDGHHRRTRYGSCLGNLLRLGVFQEGFRIIELGCKCLVTHLFHHDHGRLLVEHLIDGHHLAHLHQSLHHLGALDRHFVGKIGHGDGLGNMNIVNLRLRWRNEVAGLLRCMLIFATRTSTPATGTTRGVTTGFDRPLLGGIFLPCRRELRRLELLFRLLLFGFLFFRLFARLGRRLVKCGRCSVSGFFWRFFDCFRSGRKLAGAGSVHEPIDRSDLIFNGTPCLHRFRCIFSGQSRALFDFVCRLLCSGFVSLGCIRYCLLGKALGFFRIF